MALLNSIITKGLSTEDELLITRGFHLVAVVEEVIPPGDGGVEPFPRAIRKLITRLEFPVIGTKLFHTFIQFEVIGSPVKRFIEEFTTVYAIRTKIEAELLGTIKSDTSLEKIIEGIKRHQIFLDSNVVGSKVSTIELIRMLLGTKRHDVERLLDIVGTKDSSFLIDSITVIGTKGIDIFKDNIIRGTIFRTLTESRQVKGRRDLRPLIAALIDVDDEEEALVK